MNCHYIRTGKNRYGCLCPRRWHKGGSGNLAPPILNVGGGELLTSRPGQFNAWSEPRFPLSRGLDGPHSRSGRFGEERNLLPLPEFELLIIQPVPTTLSRQIFVVANIWLLKIG
jgi:hypothetical protein